MIHSCLKPPSSIYPIIHQGSCGRRNQLIAASLSAGLPMACSASRTFAWSKPKLVKSCGQKSLGTSRCSAGPKKGWCKMLFTIDWPIRGFLSETNNFMLIYSDGKFTAGYDSFYEPMSPAKCARPWKLKSRAPSAQLDGEKAAEAQPETEKGGHQGMSPKHCQSARYPAKKINSLLVSIDIPIPKDNS